MDDFATMNEAYDEFFSFEPKPVSQLTAGRVIAVLISLQARTCVAVKQLPFNTDVEIECTAYLN